MSGLTRRAALASAGAALCLPHLAIAQGARPAITVAVQKISNSNSLEMLREQSNVGGRIFYSYAEPLIDTDWTGDLSLRPGLATSWRRLDAQRLELTLREGVRFHDGRPMTAEDVVYSFGPRMWGAEGSPRNPPPEAVAVARRSFPGFERVEIVDARTVRFVNRTPDVTLEGKLSRSLATIHSAAAYEAVGDWPQWSRRPVGTGPYRVVEFRPDHHLVLEAFDDYWGGRPPLSRIRFLEVPEVAARIAMLQSGEADFACDIPPDQIAEVERSPRHEVVGGLISNHRMLVFDKHHAALADPLVRRALTHAIDRDAIVQALWSGRTRVPPGLQFEFFGDMLARGWTVPKYDLAEARRLLKQSGYRGEPIPYRVLNNYYTAQTSTAQILVEGWREAGVNVRIEMRENWSQITEPGPDRAIRDWSNGASFGDPVSQTPPNFGRQGSAWVGGEWRNEEFGDLAAVLENATDAAQRRRAWARMLEIAEREDPAWTVLHQTANFTGKRRDIRWKPAQAFVMDFRAGNWGA
ncbi:ABC transporter substrate-binding protein [Roseomonas gilardii]|uniref:ABC transporter substrate-binding protein n=1 Tax=Roseomonas gilardii TaxID=257708 RepID=UPI0011AA26C7|nr:ABC transporter substrate-binding protein [Roseomonas gilardii]